MNRIPFDQVVVGRGITLNLGVRWDAYRVGYRDEEKQPSRFRDYFYDETSVH